VALEQPIGAALVVTGAELWNRNGLATIQAGEDRGSMNRRRNRLTHRFGALVLAAAVLIGVLAPASADNLRSRLNHLLGRKERVQAQIRTIKKEQASATQRLWQAQDELSRVQGRLRSAKGQLASTRKELAATQAELKRLEKRIAQHKTDVQAHLLALYRAGPSSYLDVVLQADSFSDFANRENAVQAMANQDEYMLNRLANLETQCEAKRKRLASQERQRAALVAQIARDEATVRSRRAEVREILSDANKKRSAAEEALAAMESEENEVRSMIRARMRGGSGGGYAGTYQGTWSGSFLKPAPGRISSPFGMRLHPITGVYKLHTGVDIAAPHGTPIKAADKGLVIKTGWMRAYGQTVAVDHGSGLHTWYCHCSSILVSEGQLVKRGQVIARVGSTGMSTGPHLHFSVLKNGNFVNPMAY
jgi:murein DD-endopeptidase MepM/ murein hydrolase activator NlpD